METRDIKEVYRDIARTLDAYQNCIKSNNTEWQDKHEERLKNLIDELPHGSGIDGEWNLDHDVDANKMIRLYCDYHAMNDNGCYDGWISFIVTVRPHLFLDIALTITGNFGKRQDIKDYLYEILQ